MSFAREQALSATARWLSDRAQLASAPVDMLLLDQAMTYCNALGRPIPDPPPRTLAEKVAGLALSDLVQTRVFDTSNGPTVIHLKGALSYEFPLDDALRAISSAGEIGLFIDCSGGDGSAALQIYQALRGKKVCVTIMGSCFSAAALLLCAGEQRRIVPDGKIMIHGPVGFNAGTSAELRRAADWLDQFRDTMADILTTRCKPELVADWLSNGRDNYLDASEALAAGLVTEILDPDYSSLK
jgi:ATP-dependent Clp protease protease subunit